MVCTIMAGEFPKNDVVPHLHRIGGAEAPFRGWETRQAQESLVGSGRADDIERVRLALYLRGTGSIRADR
jgi:hypothetical protein